MLSFSANFQLPLISLWGVFFRTKAEPPIYYLPKQPLEKDATLLDQQREQVS
jgi:hypothetical protein